MKLRAQRASESVQAASSKPTDPGVELARSSIPDFIPWLSKRYQRPTHLEPLLRRFEMAVAGQPQRVCCGAPPRHAKTESVLHVPAWALWHDPELTLSYSTYADRLSRSKSRKARRLVEALGIETTGGVNEWRTAEGGGLLAGGVGGPLTGHGVNIAIVDDPVKNRQDAESVVRREGLVDWMRDVLMTRIEPRGSIFVFMTRWHPDDLIGTLVDEGFDYLRFPALTEAGEALWPERWSAAELRKLEESVGEYTWTSLYQQSPRPRGSRLFGDVHHYEKLPIVFRPGGGVDSAYSMKKTADYSAYVTMVRAGEYFYVTDAMRVREPMAHFKARLHTVHGRHPTMTWRWYVASSESGAASLLATGEDAIPLHGRIVQQDKFIRAQNYAAAWNAGKVLLPEGAPWADDFITEHASFTGVNDRRDDLVDAATACFDELNEAPAGVSGKVADPSRTPTLRSGGM